LRGKKAAIGWLKLVFQINYFLLKRRFGKYPQGPFNARFFEDIPLETIFQIYAVSFNLQKTIQRLLLKKIGIFWSGRLSAQKPVRDVHHPYVST
jgi:hypothetical protein